MHKINEARRDVEVLRQQLKSLLAAENTPADVINETTVQLESAVNRLKALQMLEDPAPAAEPVVQVAKSLDGGNLVLKSIVSQAIAAVHRIPLEQAVKKAYPMDDGMVLKAAAGPTQSNTAGNAQEMVSTRYWQGLLDILRGASIIGNLNLTRVSLVGGALSVPFRDGTVKAADQTNWRAEGAPIKAGTAKLGLKVVQQKLTGALMAVSMEAIQRCDVVAIEATLRGILQADLAETLDTAFLSDTAGTATVPEGILHGVALAKIGAAPTGADVMTGVVDEVSKMLDAKLPAAGIQLAMSPSQRLKLAAMVNANGAAIFPGLQGQGAGQIAGFGVAESAFVPNGKIIAVHAPSIFAGIDGIEVQTSTEATVDLGGASPVSLWQNNLLGLRATTACGWGAMREGVVGGVSFEAKA